MGTDGRRDGPRSDSGKEEPWEGQDIPPGERPRLSYSGGAARFLRDKSDTLKALPPAQAAASFSCFPFSFS